MMSMPTVVFFTLMMGGTKNEKCIQTEYCDIIEKCDFPKNSFFILIKYRDSS